MEESSSSVNVCCRKRKRSRMSSSNSNSLIGVVTRSKSRVNFSHNHSGIARPEKVSGQLISCRPEIESVEAFLEVNCNNGSRVSSIKDLRLHRVFTPDVNSVLEVEEVENEQGKKKKLKDSEAGSDSKRASDPDDAKVDELEKSEIMLSDAQDEVNDTETGLNLKDQAGEISISKSKMAFNRCGRRKVFKTLSSLNYRRLLPYLMDIANDDSSAHKIEIVDARVRSKLQKLDVVNSEKVEGVVPQFDDIEPSGTEDVQNFRRKMASDEEDLSGAEKELDCSAEIDRPLDVEQKGLQNDLCRVSASVKEECCQTTPPNPDIFTETGEESVEANNLLADNQDSKGSSVGSEKGNGFVLRQSPNGKRGTNSNNGWVLNPCSRLRLFKNPRSLSYRRLLPFLMDISKDNSCASRTIPQVDMKEDLYPVCAAAEQDFVNELRAENFGERQRTEDGSSLDTNNRLIPLIPQSSSTNDLSKVESSSVTSEAIADPCTPINLATEGTPQPQSSPRKFKQGLNSKENRSPSFSVNNDIVSKKPTSVEPEPVGKPKLCLDMGSGLKNNKTESIEKVNLNRSSSRAEVSGAFVAPTNGPSKGILKKNRRGCRGLCNCLNCASFRLHADRAFEFSKNQMQDAEEVASELMKELANLRLLLEKSIINDNDLAAIQLNPVVVKEACNKALETQNAAKERLSQLNDDLNVHCRIPVLLPPKVSFAPNCVQERAITPEKKG